MRVRRTEQRGGPPGALLAAPDGTAAPDAFPDAVQVSNMNERAAAPEEQAQPMALAGGAGWGSHELRMLLDSIPSGHNVEGASRGPPESAPRTLSPSAAPGVPRPTLPPAARPAQPQARRATAARSWPAPSGKR